MESQTEVNFGKSIIVPSVQELTKEPIFNIPARYVRDDQEDPLIVSYDPSLPSVPVIDLERLDVEAYMNSELDSLHSACKDWGFFQEPNNQEGFGQLFVVSDEQKLDWSDMFYITTLPHNIRMGHLFDKLQPNLRETLETYSIEVKKLALTILGHMAKALKMDVEEMRELFSDGVQSMRMNYYPQCPEPDKAIGFTPHSDADALTILCQVNETEGLQIRKEGRWILVKPLPNAFVVNVGDIMEIVSNGIYRSIEHRAIVNSTKERLSIATFYSSNLDSELGPAPSLIGPGNPANFWRVPLEKYFKEFFARKLSGKSYLDFMRIENGEGNTNQQIRDIRVARTSIFLKYIHGVNNRINLGKSIIVPSVQQLSKEPIINIPARYVRDDQEEPLIVSHDSSLPSVPVIDLERLDVEDCMNSELDRFHSACKDWGFFQVVNHGVSTSLLEEIRTQIESFFKLPYEEKKKLWQQPNHQEGFGQVFVVSDEQKLDWSDMFFVTTQPHDIRRDDLFDKLPTKLRGALETYSIEVKKLAMTILGYMAKALKMDAEEMRELFNDGVQTMRMNYYPCCPEPDKTIGITPHSDADALTVVFQLNESEGLQIRKEGRWIPVKPLPNAFIVNIDSELGPAPSLIDPDNPANFRRVSMEKYRKEFFTRKLDGKSYLDFMRIENGEGNTC
ncbi:protein srg1 [Quercus suber]|uniref:Protein srg1 n=1 Tax=Quercus suber TaxID=58331 RepID=A0AAW0L2Q6_QUESU